MEQGNWWQEVEAIIQKHSLLKHPFYQAWQAGKLSVDDLRHYAIQYYPHVAKFPDYVTSVRSSVRDAETRQMLTNNLREELDSPKELAGADRGQERIGPNNHPDLWLRFAEGLGLNRKEIFEAVIQTETWDCVDAFVKLTDNPNPLTGIAALYAYESQIPEISSTKIDGLKKFYGISDRRSLEFFEAHRTADVWHSQEERDAIQAMARSQADREAVKESAGKACRAVWKLLDGVVEARQIGACVIPAEAGIQ